MGMGVGGVHTRMHVYWGWHPLQGVYLHNWGVTSTSSTSTTGGVPSGLWVCIPGCMCTGGGIHYRGCTFITGGWHPPVLHPLQGGVPSSLGVCIPGPMCTGGHPLQGVYLHSWGCAYQDAYLATTSQKYLVTWIETKICLWDNIY